MEKNKGGRPPAYTNKEQIKGLIEDYFKRCEGKILEDKEGNPIINKYGEPVYIDREPLTITGLALALGFNSRTSLLNYQDKEEFMNTITRAKAIVQQYSEKRLFDKDGVNGAKFNLANNFGYTERQTVEAVNTNINLQKDVSSMTDDEISEEIAKLTKGIK